MDKNLKWTKISNKKITIKYNSQKSQKSKNPKLNKLKIRNGLPSLTSKLIKWTKIKKGKH